MADNQEPKIRYLVKDSRGEFVIEIPEAWKITFATVNPASAHGGREGFCLRVYNGEKLRAVYGNVTGVRDLAIPLARKVSKETGSAEWSRDSEGSFEQYEKIQKDETFVIDAGKDPFGEDNG